jgi:amino acid permease
MAAGEAKNPRRNLPKAIRRVYIRILLFYIGGTFIIGLLVPSNNTSLQLNKGTAASPFVIAIETTGTKSLPSVSHNTTLFVHSQVFNRFGIDYKCLFTYCSVVCLI